MSEDCHDSPQTIATTALRIAARMNGLLPRPSVAEYVRTLGTVIPADYTWPQKSEGYEFIRESILPAAPYDAGPAVVKACDHSARDGDYWACFICGMRGGSRRAATLMQPPRSPAAGDPPVKNERRRSVNGSTTPCGGVSAGSTPAVATDPRAEALRRANDAVMQQRDQPLAGRWVLP